MRFILPLLALLLLSGCVIEVGGHPHWWWHH